MAHFLKEYRVSKRQETDLNESAAKVVPSFRRLIKDCFQKPPTSVTFKQPNVDRQCTNDHKRTVRIFDDDALNWRACEAVATPSTFGAFALARQIVFRYANYLKAITEQDSGGGDFRVEAETERALSTVKSEMCHTPGGKSLSIGLNCLFRVLADLSKKDPELCCSALHSLHQLLQQLRPDSLATEPAVFISNLTTLLESLAKDACEEVQAKALTCLIGLSIGCGQPEILLRAVTALLSVGDVSDDDDTRRSGDFGDPLLINLPNNFQQLGSHLFAIVAGKDGATSVSSGVCETPVDSLHSIITLALADNETSSPEEPSALARRTSGAIASDGSYVYVLTGGGLYKLGTGLNNTVANREYSSNLAMKAAPGSWLVLCNGSLYLRRKKSTRLWVLDTDSLREIGEILLPAATSAGCSICSDGKAFRSVLVDAAGNLTLTELNDSFNPVDGTQQRFRLVDTAFERHGEPTEVMQSLLELKNNLCRQAADLQIGKDIAVLLARTGKIYYSGKGAKVGLQDTGQNWMELVLPEPIVAISVSPDSNNVSLRATSGHVWIAGHAALDIGSNGTQSMPKKSVAVNRLRRLATANRKKCMASAVSAAALVYVTENGRVFMNGRHTVNCLPETGQVVGLENVHVISAALGKTHAVALSRHGQVYTWGFNNLFQCGRSEPLSSADSTVASTSSNETMASFNLCPPTEHIWFKDVPTVCAACGLCTAHGKSCVTTSTTASRMSPAKQTNLSGAAAASGSCGSGESGCLRCGVCRRCGERDGDSPATRSDRDSDLSSERSHKMLLNPSRIPLPSGSGELKVTSVSCGNYHTILLTADGQVFTFGSNCHGQLGVGDTRRRIGPQKVQLPDLKQIVQIASGASHCVLRSADGYALTFGSYRFGQLGRNCSPPSVSTMPGYIESVNPEMGVSARWVGATGTATVVHYSRQIVSADTLYNGEIIANQSYMMVFPKKTGDLHNIDSGATTPTDYQYLVINLKNRSFNCVQTDSEISTKEMRWCLDPLYDIVWVHMIKENAIHGLAKWFSNDAVEADADLSFIRCPSFWVPTMDVDVTCSPNFLAVAMLSHIYVATKLTTPGSNLMMTDGGSAISVHGRALLRGDASSPSSSECRRVARFHGFGGGWGYSAHSVEALQFQPSRNVRVHGLALFGGRGEYLARAKLLHLVGSEYDEKNLELLAETDETLFDCSPRETASVLFSKPVQCKAQRWYIAWVQISGPSSDCGAGGVTSVVGDDGVAFYFRNSRLSNNGTDVNVGQIPEIIYSSCGEYSVATQPRQTDVDVDSSCSQKCEQQDDDESEMAKLTQFFQLQTCCINTISILISICHRAIEGAFKLQPSLSKGGPYFDGSENIKWATEQCCIVAIMALRLLKQHLLSILNQEEEKLEEHQNSYQSILVKFRKLLDTIYELGVSLHNHDPRSYIVEEALIVQTSCLKVLYPNNLQLHRSLHQQMMQSERNSWQFVSLLEGLADSSSIIDVVNQQGAEAEQPVVPMNGAKTKQEMPPKQPMTGFIKLITELAFSDIQPQFDYVQSRLKTAAASVLTGLFRELACTNDGRDQPILETSCRFRRTSTHPNWDMTTGAADSVAFRIDQPGVILCGISIYVGTSTDYQFSLELVLNQGDSLSKESWHILEKVSGSVVVSQQHYKEVAFILFNKPVKLLPHNLYAVRVFLQGGKTWAGDWGVESIPAVNGALITFEACSLSLNGTNVSRGQIPSLLITTEVPQSSDQCPPEEIQKQFMQSLKLIATKLMNCLQTATVSTDSKELFRQLFGWVSVFLLKNASCCLDVIAILDELIPLVASTNGQHHSNSTRAEKQLCQTVVESEHPYAPNNIFSQIVQFDSSVRMICLEFSRDCCLAQLEDSLTVYLQVEDGEFYPVLQCAGGKNWPKEIVLIPGNKLWFLLEASHKSEVPPSQMYGFRCVVTGYRENSRDMVIHLEQEIVWLCSFACRILFENVPNSNPVEVSLENGAGELIQKHGPLLRKGFALTRCPTVHEAVKKTLPGHALSQEVKFLKEFIMAHSTTLAGGLARWLTLAPVIDLERCELSVPAESICVGHPVMIHLIPKDQFGRLATCSEMKCSVTIKAGSSENSYPSMKNLPAFADLQKDAYQPTYLNKARYTAVTMMKQFRNFSFEELRMGYFRDAVMREEITLQLRQDLLEGTWIPKQAGTFRIECRLDGFQLAQTYHIDVFNDEAMAQSGARSKRRVAQLSKAQFAVPEISTLRQGIRIRAAPSLVAHQIGIIHKGSVISYIEEIQNSDGTWLRLTDESLVLLCGSVNFITQAWVLQYNKHIQKVLLVKTIENGISATDGIQNQSIVIEANERYQISEKVQNESESVGVAALLSPSIGAETIATLYPGTVVKTNLWIHNSDGIWVRVAGTEQYCMIQSRDGTTYLERKSFSTSHSSASTGSSHEDQQHISNGNADSAMDEGVEASSTPRRKPQATVHPRSYGITGRPIDAMRPAKIDCSRSVFAAFVWHEGLVKDVMACAAYFRFHSELNAPASQMELEQLPGPLQPIARLWTEISSAVQASIDQHMITSNPVATTVQNRRLCRVASSSYAGGGNEELCELCEEWFAVPVTTHMRIQHAGCGRHSGGHGYNSLGKYTSGWSGNCGEGGRHPATWYLLCALCRRKHLRQTPSAQMNLERNRAHSANKAKAGSIEAHMIIKANATFLLELNQSADTNSKNTSENSSGWTVNLFPHSSSPPSVTRSGDNDLGHSQAKVENFRKPNYASHASDPGPKLPLQTMANSVPCSEPPGALLCRRRVTATDTYQPASSAMGEILRSPSTALRSFVTSQTNQTASTSAVLRRRVLSFITEHHDLKLIREAIETATFRAVIFGHSFKVWNWLLRLVSTEGSVCDILWHYLAALDSYKSMVKSEINEKIAQAFVLPHPWHICFLAGPLANQMVGSFHALLHTISVILRSDCVEASLRRLCFRAWTFNLTIHEQDLVITTCNILSTVGKVLAEPCDVGWLDDDLPLDCIPPIVNEMDDISKFVEIKASSRAQMTKCLTDGNSETFWESGEEDKQKPKTLTLYFDHSHYNPLLVAVHVDNERDEGFRISQVTFHALNQAGKKAKNHLGQYNLGPRFNGWVKCYIPEIHRLQIEIKGPDASCRLHSLCVLGRGDNCISVSESSCLKPSPSHFSVFTTTQSDAFQLFQAIASQAFTDEFSTEQNGTLRQQVFDLLFSRIQLQPLQGYVCAQIATALEKEVNMLRDRTKRNYSYCCGLLSMLAKICTSKCPIDALGSKGHLLVSLSELLLFSSTMVQVQCLDTIEKVLLHVTPAACDTKSFVTNLLITVAKQISIQVRQRTSHTVSTASMHTWLTDVPHYWRLDKTPTVEITRLVKTLLIEAACSRFGDQWARAVQTEVSGHVMYLTTIGEECRTHHYCLKSRRFWISTSALATLKDENWLKQSTQYQALQRKSGQVEPTVCENHDDGKTVANVYCEVCVLSLCRECYTVLHLSRRARTHAVQMLSLGDVCPELDVHEGSTRFRLPWLLVLFNSAAMNGMLEFCNINQQLLCPRSDVDGSDVGRVAATGGVCRFCGNLLSDDRMTCVCDHVDCQRLATTACCQALLCGHPCGGIIDEIDCLPCLRCNIAGGATEAVSNLRQDNDDLCVICFTDRLGAAPSIQLECGHVFHHHCVNTTLSRRWNGPRIAFGFLHCPLCKAPIEHSTLRVLLEPLRALYNEVASKAKLRLEYDALVDDPSLKSANSPFYNDPISYALDRYVYVLCNRCGKAYFGGESQCQQLINSQYNPEELVCGGCSDVSRAEICAKHGSEYLEYKCRFCCSIAVYFCFGTTHFCTGCHDDFQRLMSLPKQTLPQCPVGPKATPLADGVPAACPLKVSDHPPTGEEFALGCGICRNLSTF